MFCMNALCSMQICLLILSPSHAWDAVSSGLHTEHTDVKPLLPVCQKYPQCARSLNPLANKQDRFFGYVSADCRGSTGRNWKYHEIVDSVRPSNRVATSSILVPSCTDEKKPGHRRRAHPLVQPSRKERITSPWSGPLSCVQQVSHRGVWPYAGSAEAGVATADADVPPQEFTRHGALSLAVYYCISTRRGACRVYPAEAGRLASLSEDYVLPRGCRPRRLLPSFLLSLSPRKRTSSRSFPEFFFPPNFFILL